MGLLLGRARDARIHVGLGRGQNRGLFVAQPSDLGNARGGSVGFPLRLLGEAASNLDLPRRAVDRPVSLGHRVKRPGFLVHLHV